MGISSSSQGVKSPLGFGIQEGDPSSARTRHVFAGRFQGEMARRRRSAQIDGDLTGELEEDDRSDSGHDANQNGGA